MDKRQKVTAKEAREMRRMRGEESMTLQAIAAHFGYSISTITVYVKNIKPQKKIPRGRNYKNDFITRDAEIKRLRFEEFWKLEDIGDKYKISRERVRQIVGNQKVVLRETRELRKKVAASPLDRTCSEVGDIIGFHHGSVRNARLFLYGKHWRYLHRIAFFCTQVNRGHPDECWEWQGNIGAQGYGRYRWNGKGETTHRIAWLLLGNAIPDRLQILHHCDNPPCVNPNHLYIGTAKDNMVDRERRGRGGAAKLTPDDVHGIRYLNKKYGRKLTYMELGALFGVGQHAIYHVIKRNTFAWVEDQETE